MHLGVAGCAEQGVIQAKVQAGGKTESPQHAERVVAKGFAGRQWCPDEAIAKIGQAMAREVLNLAHRDVVEERVRCKVAPLCILGGRAYGSHWYSAVLRVCLCAEVVHIQREAVEPEASRREVLALIWVLLHDADGGYHVALSVLGHVLCHLQGKLLPRHVVHDDVNVIRAGAQHLVPHPAPSCPECGAQAEVIDGLEQRLEHLLLELRKSELGGDFHRVHGVYACNLTAQSAAPATAVPPPGCAAVSLQPVRAAGSTSQCRDPQGQSTQGARSTARRQGQTLPRAPQGP
mmetsp:Transcript_68615/g.155510  ORF Transcript_68615/g.155510 Transcript_68615/m.155510 type:complete len:290 (-) Transcript_68615:79-948(-)